MLQILLTHRLHIGIILLAVGLIYLATMPRFITLEDAGLFQMVCHLDGVNHPPGYPLFTLLCNQIASAPGVIAGNLISVIFALATLLVFYQIVGSLVGDNKTALIAVLAYAFSATFWSQAIIIEVYSLAACLFMLSWLLLLKFTKNHDVSYWYALCFVTGLALTNHWPLFVLSGAGLIGLVVGSRQALWTQLKTPYFLVVSVLLFALGLSPYVLLFSNHNPEIAVYGAVSVDSFFDYVTRSYYNDQSAGAELIDKMKYLLWLVPESGLQLGVAATPLLLLGIYRSFRQLSMKNAVSLVAIFLMSTYVLMLMLSFKFEPLYQGVFRPYPIIAYAALSLWFALGLRWLVEQIPEDRSHYRLIVAVFFILTIIVYNFPKLDRSASRLVDSYARIILESLPQGAILFVSGDNEVGPIGYLNRVEGLRPDVTLYEVNGLVFSNRLSEVSASKEERAKAREAFIRNTTRPVFSISVLPTISVVYGLYFRLESGVKGDDWRTKQLNYQFLPEFAGYLDYVLNLYENDLLWDLHEKHFAHNILVDFSRQYMNYSLMDELSEENLSRLQRMQFTFPGALVSAETLMQTELAPERKLAVLVALETIIPEQAPKQHIALVYEYLGRVLNQLARDDEAIQMFERSVSIESERNNKSICLLSRLYNNSKRVEDLKHLQEKFPLSECQ